METKSLNLDEISFPGVDLELDDQGKNKVDNAVTFSDVPDVGENQLLVEGAAQLQDHPDLKKLVGDLVRLQNELLSKVKEVSKSYKLESFAKVLFSVREK